MRANICALRFSGIYGVWDESYGYVIESLKDLGYDIRISAHIDWDNPDRYSDIPIGLEHESENDLFIYNHTYINKLKDEGFYRGSNNIFIKPTGPSPRYFTLDSLGYGCHLNITYNKPEFEHYDYTHFFNTEAKLLIKNKENKWSNRGSDLKSVDLDTEVPNNHVLVLGQMPNDDSVIDFSFGDHWKKIVQIVSELEKLSYPIVVKLHPTMHEVETPFLENQIEKWKDKGVVVIQDYSSLHDVLEKTKVAIIENSTSGIECMLHSIPIISYGYPEYHWVTKDLRHLTMLRNYIEDMSWYDLKKSKSFIAWYCEEYLCYDKLSTYKRLKQLVKQ